MDDLPGSPTPHAHHGLAAPPPAPPRRRVRVPVIVVALVVGLASAGAGYAAVRLRPGQPVPVAGAATAPAVQPWTVGGFGGRASHGWSGRAYAASPPGSSVQPPTTTSTDTTTRATAAQVRGLVRIVAQQAYDGATAAGTGLVLTSTGEVVTNHHVVADATSIRVTVMGTGRTYTARLVGSDTAADVAVLRLVGASGLPTVRTDTSALAAGDRVVAVGDADGASTFSAATGKVLGTGQTITTQSSGGATGETLNGLVEISSDVISGDSGGATYDSQGEVAGMTTAASTGRDVVGYAIPIATVLRIAEDLKSGASDAAYTYGYPAFLGVALGRGTSPTVAGVYDGTPAARAGLAAGDRIIRVGGARVATAQQLRSVIAALRPGQRVSVTWTDPRGTTHLATVVLAAGPVR